MKPKLILSTLCALTLASVVALVVIAQRQTKAESHSNERVRTFEVQGVVRGVDLTNKTIRITHEEIRGYMPAMTMPFDVKEVALLDGLAAGDRVRFELMVTADDSWLGRIDKIASADSETAADNSTATLEDRESERVHAGEVVPDFELVNQDGQKFRLSDFHGRAVLLTFVYTRCPLPNFCPLMSKNFADLEQRLRKEFPGRYHLLSVSMDPDFDTPAVLKDYASRYEADPADWTFGTGDAAQIEFVAQLMGLYYVRENGLISHDLRTALVSPDGRLVHLWKSNAWTPYEVQRRVRETLTGNQDVASR